MHNNVEDASCVQICEDIERCKAQQDNGQNYLYNFILQLSSVDVLRAEHEFENELYVHAASKVLGPRHIIIGNL